LTTILKKAGFRSVMVIHSIAGFMGEQRFPFKER
jgi:hypothetical protein